MKYGYNETSWRENEKGGALNDAIIAFNMRGYQNFMKRKTVREDELEMLKALKEMVEMMEAHAEKIKG